MDRASIEDILKPAIPPYYDLFDIKISEQNFQILEAHGLNIYPVKRQIENKEEIYTLLFITSKLELIAGINSSIPIRDDCIEALAVLLTINPNPTKEAVIEMAVEFSE